MGEIDLDFPKLRTSQQEFIMHVKKKKKPKHALI
jgi:hypothetical protein